MKRTILKVGVVALLALAACAPDYTYVPVTTSSAVVAGRPAADYTFKKTGARAPLAGEVRLAALGILAVHRQGDPVGADVRAVRVRFVLNNVGETAWVLDPREIYLALSGTDERIAALAPTTLAEPPSSVRAEPGSQPTVDLFFPLPSAAADASNLRRFDVVWHLQTDQGLIERRTTFDRHTVDQPGEDDDRWQRYGL